MTKVEELKKEWGKYTNNQAIQAKKEFIEFKEWMGSIEIENMALNQYTNLITKNNNDSYFTNWIERKTEQCGKFRTGSSYAYGVYRVNQKEEGYRTSDQRDQTIDKKPANLYFEKVVRPILINLQQGNYPETDPLDVNYVRKVAYMFNPGKSLPIFKKEVIEAIADFFLIQDNDFDPNHYKATAIILNKIKNEFQPDKDSEDFCYTQKLGTFLWDHFGKSFSLEHKNIIFYGAPGTGKTYAVQQGIKQRIMLDGGNETEVCVFAQFHPSYSYEDFIEGLKPVVENGSITLKLQSGQFKKLCKKAMDNLKAARNKILPPPEKLKNFYFIADEINRAELSRVLGEVLVCVEESKRIDFDDTGNVNTGLYLKSQYSHLYQNDEDAVLTIDKEHYFGIPSNLYFIGTMNDIDRSIDSFDLALRRRFVWKRMDCNYAVIKDTLLSEAGVDEYIEICKTLNKLITETWMLGKAYQIGHAYFMGINKISNTTVQNLFNSKIAPLLAEYLRAEYPANEIETKLKQAKNIFSLPKTNKQGPSQTTPAGEND